MYFYTGRSVVNHVGRSVLSTSAILLYLGTLLYRFQNKQLLLLARGVFDKQVFVIIHYFSGKQLSSLCIYSTVHNFINYRKIPFENVFFRSPPEALWKDRSVK